MSGLTTFLKKQFKFVSNQKHIDIKKEIRDSRKEFIKDDEYIITNDRGNLLL